MARKVRMEEAGGLFHVINRGNYRRDLFDNPGTAGAFLEALFEAAGKFRWHVYAYVLMRNHFHLAVETVEPTLGEGMHWLQGTMAVRFNRFRNERGHLFQGRYKAMPIEDAAALARVVDYIHLNPVRAKVVEPEWVARYRWSSLAAVSKQNRPAQLQPQQWLQQRGYRDDREGIAAYTAELVQLADDETAWERAGVVGLSKGWAIGTSGWRKALAKDYARLALMRGLDEEDRRAVRQATWEQAVELELAKLGKVEADLLTQPRKQPWKVQLAERLRSTVGAKIAWLAKRLHLGQPNTLRGYLHQTRKAHNQQNAA
jgi:putative transposase